MLLRFLLMLPTVASGPAHASYPDDIYLSQMSEWQGDPVEDPKVIQGAFGQLVRELGTSIANKPVCPGETLGPNGFDVSVYSTWSFIDSTGTDAEPSAWQRSHANGTPSAALWMPWVSVRKGLPLSLEFGANLGYIGFSRQTALGAFGRWALIEGYRNAPDLTVQMGYTTYVGNSEMELGVMDSSISIGYTLPFGTTIGINQAAFSPYLGAGVLRMNGKPRLNDDQLAALGLSSVSGFKRNEAYVDGYAPFQGSVGFQLRSGDFEFKLAGAFVPKVVPSVTTGFGFVY